MNLRPIEQKRMEFMGAEGSMDFSSRSYVDSHSDRAWPLVQKEGCSMMSRADGE